MPNCTSCNQRFKIPQWSLSLADAERPFVCPNCESHYSVEELVGTMAPEDQEATRSTLNEMIAFANTPEGQKIMRDAVQEQKQQQTAIPKVTKAVSANEDSKVTGILGETVVPVIRNFRDKSTPTAPEPETKTETEPEEHEEQEEVAEAPPPAAEIAPHLPFNKDVTALLDQIKNDEICTTCWHMPFHGYFTKEGKETRGKKKAVPCSEANCGCKGDMQQYSYMFNSSRIKKNIHLHLALSIYAQDNEFTSHQAMLEKLIRTHPEIEAILGIAKTPTVPAPKPQKLRQHKTPPSIVVIDGDQMTKYPYRETGV